MTSSIPSISANMPLATISEIKNLPHRALALSFTDALDPKNPMALALVKPVDVPEAGSWGANAVARMAFLKAAPKTLRGRKKCQVAFDGQPNLFMAFANEDHEHETVVAPDEVIGAAGSANASEQEGK